MYLIIQHIICARQFGECTLGEYTWSECIPHPHGSHILIRDIRNNYDRQ